MGAALGRSRDFGGRLLFYVFAAFPVVFRCLDHAQHQTVKV